MNQRSVGFLWIKMRCIGLLLFLTLLLFSGQIQGSTDIIQKFLLTGVRSSIIFYADDLPKDFAVSFYDSNITIGTCYCDEAPKLMKNFTGKVELSCPTSLIFPSPQKSDCGVYSAQVIGDQPKIVKYNVTFQDPVSPVQLKVDAISNSPCDHKVTCSTEDVELSGSVRCDDASCRLEGGERSKVTRSGASLTLYQSNQSIICNHSNQVNWTQNKTEIRPCLRSEGSTDIKIPIAVLLVVAIIVGVAICLKKKKLFCFAQSQTESDRDIELADVPQANGDPESDRLVKENTEESPAHTRTHTHG